MTQKYNHPFRTFKMTFNLSLISQELIGNENSAALWKNELKPAIRSRTIRIYPKEPFSVMLHANDSIPSCLRLELHGCSVSGIWRTVYVYN